MAAIAILFFIFLGHFLKSFAHNVIRPASAFAALYVQGTGQVLLDSAHQLAVLVVFLYAILFWVRENTTTNKRR